MKKTEILDNVQVETIEGEDWYQIVIGKYKFAKPSYGTQVFMEYRLSDGKMRAYKLGDANNVEEFVTIVKEAIDE